jgi:hypothetical protein
LAAVATAIYKFRDARPRRRATLKADLELLSAAWGQHLDCKEFEAYVQSELSHLYRRTTTTDWGTIAIGLLFALGFGGWTAYLVSDGFSWWAIATGFLAFGGLSMVVTGLFDPSRVASEARDVRKSEDSMVEAHASP